MKSVMGQIDRDSLLVMHAAGELSPEDARRVESMLAADPALRAEYDGLWNTLRAIDEALATGDEGSRLPVDVRICERRIGRMIREWAAVRPERPATVVQKVVGLKYPWWTYPLTAAAAVFLAFLVWWGNTPMRPDLIGNGPATQEVDEATLLADDLEQSFAHPSKEGIRAAEGELYALSMETDDAEDAGSVTPQQTQDLN